MNRKKSTTKKWVKIYTKDLSLTNNIADADWALKMNPYSDQTVFHIGTPSSETVACKSRSFIPKLV